MVPELAEGGAGQLRVPYSRVCTLAPQRASGVHFPQQVPPTKQTTQQDHLDQCCWYYGHGHMWPRVIKMKSSEKSSS